MPINQVTPQPQEIEPARPIFQSMTRGIAGKCPACGSGKLFKRGLKVEENCDVCHEELLHHRADDLPAYLNIFIIGHVVVALTMIVMDYKIFEMWTLMGLASILAVALAFILMRPLKGMVVGAQWAMRMHGFGGHDD